MLNCCFSGTSDSVGSGYAGEPSQSESGPDDEDGQVQESQISIQPAPGQLHVTVNTTGLVCILSDGHSGCARVQQLMNTQPLT